ncbi:MAG: hypothetical protein CM15mP107_1920 [Bacteroidota bacterium]|nr:MAG: hypothetical protein CM15mP107_1920 [Bacteroidota bacterium]
MYISGLSINRYSFRLVFFSTHIIPDNPSLESVISNNLDKIIIIKDNYGNAFLPEWNFNGIGEITLGQGYQSKFSSSDVINICGEFAYPELNPINLVSGWNMIAYLRTTSAPTDVVFQDIISSDNFIIAKDYLGNAFLPSWNYNGIGEMVLVKVIKLK